MFRGGLGRWGYIALHTVGAGVFFFLLQRYALDQPHDTAMKWAMFFGVAAALVAYGQTRK